VTPFTGANAIRAKDVPMQPSFDDIAESIAPHGIANDVVTTCGYVGASTSSEMFRLYTDPWFIEWYEIKNADLVYQQTCANRLDGRSVIWVKATAKVTKCESGTAAHFADELMSGGPDPASVTLNRDKKPPP
jgi:hypothetical protein